MRVRVRVWGETYVAARILNTKVGRETEKKLVWQKQRNVIELIPFMA